MSIRTLATAGAALLFAVTAAPQTSAETLLERGTYLMQSIVACGNCHTPKGPNGEIPGMELAGMSPFEKTPAFDANAPNITPDKETGIGNWTDEQIIASIREGKRPDGSIIGPPMPIGMPIGFIAIAFCCICATCAFAAFIISPNGFAAKFCIDATCTDASCCNAATVLAGQWRIGPRSSPGSRRMDAER